MMHCPICKKSVTWEDNPFRPFCSERCKLLDLDNWLAGRYRVSTPASAEDLEVAEDADPNTKEDRG
jgi:uncharacterized protein